MYHVRHSRRSVDKYIFFLDQVLMSVQARLADTEKAKSRSMDYPTSVTIVTVPAPLALTII